MRGFNGRVLICGSRDFGVWINPETRKKEIDFGSVEFYAIDSFLQGMYNDWDQFRGVSHLDPFVVIEGDAWGADQIAGKWADHQHKNGLSKYVQHERYPADWEKYGRGAGPIRNQSMLDLGKPTLVVAFSNDFSKSKGTLDMIKRSQKAEVPVVKIEVPRLTVKEDMNNMQLF